MCRVIFQKRSSIIKISVIKSQIHCLLDLFFKIDNFVVAELYSLQRRIMTKSTSYNCAGDMRKFMYIIGIISIWWPHKCDIYYNYYLPYFHYYANMEHLSLIFCREIYLIFKVIWQWTQFYIKYLIWFAAS